MGGGGISCVIRQRAVDQLLRGPRRDISTSSTTASGSCIGSGPLAHPSRRNVPLLSFPISPPPSLTTKNNACLPRLVPLRGQPQETKPLPQPHQRYHRRRTLLRNVREFTHLVFPYAPGVLERVELLCVSFRHGCPRWSISVSRL